MTAVVQRVLEASVRVQGRVVASVGRGLAVLVAVEKGDAEGEAVWMASKLTGLRIFPDDRATKAYDRDVREIGGQVLLVSNFTVAASCAKGRRPSLDAAAGPQEAQPVFERLAVLLREQGVQVQTGQFGADMQVALVNDGPVTCLVQTPRR